MNPGTGSIQPSLSVSILRPDDLLSLHFDFYNVRKVESGGKLHLERDSADQLAYMVVHFPPQNIGEQAFFETAAEAPVTDTNDPDYGAGPENPSPPPVLSRISGPARLAFRLPPGFEIPYTVAGLLDACSRHPLSVVPVARVRSPQLSATNLAAGVPPAVNAQSEAGAAPEAALQDIAALARAAILERTSRVAQLAIRANASGFIPIDTDPSKLLLIREPTVIETAIECPYRLILSPNFLAAWAHSTGPVTSPQTRKTELWHTRLATRVTSQIDELDERYRTVRAIWCTDDMFDPQRPFKVPPHEPSGQESPFRLPLDFSDRHQIVHLTSNHSIAYYIPAPMDVDRLMLTTLGSWIDTRGVWQPPANSAPAPGEAQGLAVEEWRQRGTMGRDHLVRVVYKGYLYPFGHRAVLIKVTERKFHPDKPGNAAYSRQRMFLVVSKPERLFTHNFSNQRLTRQFPFTRIRITTTVTPDLDQPQPNQSKFWPRVNNQDFLFHIVAEGLDGKELHFTAPLMFADATAGWASIRNDMQAAGTALRRTHRLGGQSVVYAQSSKPGDTSLDTSTILFTGNLLDSAGIAALKPDEPHVHPAVAKANVSIPTLRHFAGNTQQIGIQYHEPFLNLGFGGNGNKGEVFADILTPTNLDFNARGDRSGALVKPNIEMIALSRLMGPVGGDPALIRAGQFNPASFFGSSLLDPKIFGVIRLADILPEFGDLQNQIERTPRFLTGNATAVETFLSKLDTLLTLLGMPGVPANTLATSIADVKAAIAAVMQNPLDSEAGDNLANLLSSFAAALAALAAGLPAGAGLAPLRNLAKEVTSDLQNVSSFIKNLTSGEITVRFDWKPTIKPWGPSAGSPLFIPHDPQGGLSIEAEIKARKSNPANASGQVTCRLSNFTLDLLAPNSFIALHFDKLEFFSRDGSKPDVNCVLKGIEFTGALAFVETLRRMIPLDGFSDPPALDVTAEGIEASYSVGLPNLAVGVLNLQNLSLGAGFTVPFVNEPLTVRFNFCERHQPFTLTVWAFGGGGFFSLAIDPGGVQVLEAAFEFGASLSMDFGVASGGVRVMAGIYFKIDSDTAVLSGYFRVGGNVSVLGIVSVSIELYLSLTYQFSSGKCVGKAVLTVEVEVLFFSDTVEIRCERKFTGSNGDPSFAQIMGPEPARQPVIFPWREYCDAFAA